MGGRGYGSGGRGRLYTRPYIVSTRMTVALRWAAMTAILMFLIGCDDDNNNKSQTTQLLRFPFILYATNSDIFPLVSYFTDDILRMGHIFQYIQYIHTQNGVKLLKVKYIYPMVTLQPFFDTCTWQGKGCI